MNLELSKKGDDDDDVKQHYKEIKNKILNH